MKTSLLSLAHTLNSIAVLALVIAPARADSTIDATDKYAYGANIGWINFKHDQPAAPEGAVIGTHFCSGHVYSANCGWIDLGDGSPNDGITYSNLSGSDFGLNITSLDTSASPPVATLEGYAYGANIGWINFEQTHGQPKINLSTGEFTGYAYSANCGWISLANGAQPALKTGTLDEGPDTDGDTISDSWELEKVVAAGMTTGTQAGDLALLDDATDTDSDGKSDYDEYLADTDPFDSFDVLGILSLQISAGPSNNVDLEWSSHTTRCYEIESGTDLTGYSVLVPDILPDAGSSTALTFTDSPLPPRKFWHVRAKLPLAP